LSIPVIKDDLLYVADFSGLFHCLNAKTGKVYWTVDLMFACWSSALLVDGHVYICTEDGTVHMFRHSSDPHIAMQVSSENGTHGAAFKEISMNEPIYMTPIVANNVLYIATRSMLYAIKKPPDGQEWKLTIKRGKISGDAE
jgi:outer membrane protein assembly factor BamB